MLGRVLERHISRCAGARARSGGFPRQAPCRGRRLVVFGSLSLTGPCRDAGRVAASFLGMPCVAFPASSTCRGLVSSRQDPLAGALVVLPGKLLLPGPWLALPASSSCRGLGLSTLFLNGLQGNHGGSWRSPGKPCRGALQLPVHEFGILGYPYSSTPTGAPGPGPYTVPSVVGPGPKQCTGTRGLGHAAYLSAPTARAQNSMRQTWHRGRRGRRARG